MGDSTEEEEERFLRRHSRRMKLCPRGLFDRIRPHGFVLVFADRSNGLNQLDYVRPTPGLDGMFDRLSVHSNIVGDYASVGVLTAITPSEFRHASTDAVFPDLPSSESLAFDCRSVGAARTSERQIADAVPSLFQQIREQAARLHAATNGARASVERYLKEVCPSDDLSETFDRLRNRATAEQATYAEKCIATQFVHALNLQDFRIVWQICQLAQVVCWEHAPQELIGLNELGQRPSPLQIEAHQRLQILASRMAFEPGWPMKDQLVPRRFDQLADAAPWRDTKIGSVGAALDDYFDANEMRCECGRLWRYVSHKLSGDEALSVDVCCGNAHDGNQNLSVSALQNTR